MTETSYCARHPDTPTNLRCSRCDTLVCPRCMVHSPVGVRCPDCGQGVRLPVYDVSALHLARAIGVSLALGVVGGLAIVLIVRPLVYGLLYVAAMAGYGYLVAESVSRATNRKRGRTLQYVAAGGIVVALGVLIVFTGPVDLLDLLGGGIAIYLAFTRLR